MASSGRPQSPAVRLQQTDQISDLHLSHNNAADSPPSSDSFHGGADAGRSIATKPVVLRKCAAP